MQELLYRDRFSTMLETTVDERPARVQLRRQIGRLERELGSLLAEGFGRVEVEHRVAASAGEGRVLGLGDLERTRDALAERIASARATLHGRALHEQANRDLVAAMIERPADYKWVRVTREELGEPGCGNWHSKPRLGPLGMLMGWWRVKVSSGCPLAGRLAAVDQGQAAATAAPAGQRP